MTDQIAQTVPDQTAKTCTGRCGRTLPVIAEHFARDSHNAGGFKRRCRECRNADHRDRRAGREQPQAPAAAREAIRNERADDAEREAAIADRLAAGRIVAYRERKAAQRVMAAAKSAVERVVAAEKAALAAARDGLADLAGLPAGPLLQPGEHFGDREVRLRLIRERVELAPPGHKAEAADNCRRIMRVADAELRRLREPPFDVSETFLLMADAADDDGGGIKELGAALGRLGWAP